MDSTNYFYSVDMVSIVYILTEFPFSHSSCYFYSTVYDSIYDIENYY